jgi:hypothetical protein
MPPVTTNEKRKPNTWPKSPSKLVPGGTSGNKGPRIAYRSGAVAIGRSAPIAGDCGLGGADAERRIRRMAAPMKPEITVYTGHTTSCGKNTN